MGKGLSVKAKSYIDARKGKSRRRKAFSLLAAAVVFCTVYALILPAVTQVSSPVCGLEEHTHSDSCYTVTTIYPRVNLLCNAKTLNIHEHSASCYDENNVLICGKADFFFHTHNELCCNSEGDLCCDLLEIKEHTHVGECYDSEGNLLCKEAEIAAHRHGDDCFDESGNLICEETEIAAHQHSEDCWQMGNEPQEIKTLICGLEEHIHTEECYSTEEARLVDIPLSEEEQSRVDQVISRIDALPSPSEVEEMLAAYEEAGDEEGYDARVSSLKEQIKAAEDAYALLSDHEKTAAFSRNRVAECKHCLYNLIFDAEIRSLEALGTMDEDARSSAEKLFVLLQDSYDAGELTEEDYNALLQRLYTLMCGDVNVAAEAAEGVNWIRLRDSGWFEEYSACDEDGETVDTEGSSPAKARVMALADDGAETKESPPSDVQVDNRGGSQTSEDGKVTVSKTIEGTDRENVFDITLQVQTTENVSEIYTAPDMAVVIVMDISNTMKADFGDVTRYAAAMDAAEAFLDQFAANNSLGVSKIGYVAFNTDAHRIFDLQSCSTSEQATALKNTMRTQTGTIINMAGYKDDHSRFTNIEAGLAMASDMLNSVQNKNKYIIFLSDGFPTTYISSGYSGYDPYDSTGRFYDHVLNKKCLYGTSYSDEAAIRARKKASAIKNSGTKIFSIGVDVGGQTIQKYITQSENASGFSVVDRTGTTYEIGDASSTEAYKNWLKNSIGSGHYYDSIDSEGLKSAYNQIFEEIRHLHEDASKADWVANDPIPTVPAGLIEFIGFYDKNQTLVLRNLEGEYDPGGENTAAYDTGDHQINWDLKRSGYTESEDGNTTIYTFELTYRVRLENENKENPFRESVSYPTNDTTTLQYRQVVNDNGNISISDPKNVEFPIPSVHGYLAEFTFAKVDSRGAILAGAEFMLTHDTDHCGQCRGDGKQSVTIENFTAVSDEEGKVVFSNVPSGHRYVLTETKVPDGYSANDDIYHVTVAYDQINVAVTDANGNPKEWDGKITNLTYYEMPQTGGSGRERYIVGGLLLMALASLLFARRSRERRHDRPSSR